MLFLAWSVILSSILTFVYSSNSNPGSSNHECASRYSLCNPMIAQPCCDLNDDCKETNSRNGRYKCTKQTGLGKFCNWNEHCFSIRHSKCSDNKCVCRMNNIALNDTTCVPKLGTFCWKNELCATENAVCKENKCQCITNYSSNLHDECLPNVIGAQCENDEQCHQVRFAKCSSTKTCQCDSNTIATSSMHCSSLLEGFCWSTDDCLPHNSICVDKKCKCSQGYKPQSNNTCLLIHLGMPCVIDVECSSVINHSICSKTKECICDKDYFEKDGKVCSPFLKFDLFCPTNGTCTLRNSVCIENNCQCKPRFVYQNSKCMPLYLNEPCKVNCDCNLIKHSVCSINNVCECSLNYAALNETSCKPLLNGFCSDDDDCIVVNSFCMNNKCQCKENFLKHSENLCMLAKLGSPCQGDVHCLSILNSECSKNRRCECLLNYAEYNITACAPLIGGYCSKNKLCAPKNSICINNVCFCDEGYETISNHECKPYYSSIYCRNNEDCGKLLDSNCLNNVCVCQSTHVIVNGTTCAPLLGEYCRKSQQCAPKNSVCITHRCQCETNYRKLSNKKCLQINFSGEIELPCNKNLDCIDIKYTECSNAERCVCKSNYVPLGDDKCIALIGEQCDSDDECISYNTVCIDNKCQCPEKLYMQTKYQCARISLGKPCQNNNNCGVAIKNSECSDDKICVCQNNYHALNEFECVPFLNEHCSANNDCHFNFSGCIDNKCQCKSNYHFASETQCVTNESLYSCSIDLDCGDPWHNKCSEKKCICNKNNIFINRSTCSPFLGGYCWTDHQCVVDNSHCYDYRCECIQCYRAVSNNLCLSV